MLQHYGVPLETLIILLLLEKNSYYIIKLSVLCFFIVKFDFRRSGANTCRFLLELFAFGYKHQIWHTYSFFYAEQDLIWSHRQLCFWRLLHVIFKLGRNPSLDIVQFRCPRHRTSLKYV